ncbi:MAG TPA: hypothetical protein VGF99_17015 [Myxococcota bacterium]
MFALFVVIGALAAAPADLATGAPVASTASTTQTLDLDLLIDEPDGVDPDDGTVFSATRRPSRRKPVRRTPSAPRRPAVQERNPVIIGLAGAGGAAIGSAVGLTGIGIAAAFATQLTGTQPVEVVIATAAVAIGIAVATPFMAGLGGGAGVLLADDKAQKDEWVGLMQCAASGYCVGLGSVLGSVLGVNCAPMGCTNMPGPDRPAEWTAAASIGGLVAGGLLGVIGGYTLAPDKNDPRVPLMVGGIGGALVGAATFAGVAGGIASAIRP